MSANQTGQQGAEQYANDAYRGDIMKLTQAEMAANTAKQAAWAKLYRPDGTIDPEAEAALRANDPQGYLSNMDKLHPTAKRDYHLLDTGAGTVPVFSDEAGNLYDMNGQKVNFGQQNPVQGNPLPQLPGGTLADAVQHVESGGNPNAVSPKGALGLMQTMPGTLRDPGFGVMPAQSNSPDEMKRVGVDYLSALTQKYGTTGGLAAYNWGPGNWDKALAASGGDPQRALAMAPAETRAYVPKVLARAGGVESAIPSQTASGSMAPRSGFDSLPGFVPKPPKERAPSELERRIELARSMGASPEEIKGMVMGGSYGTAPTPGDTTKTGDEYLATLPPEMRPVVKAIAEGRQAPPSASSRSPQAQQILQAVYAYDPTANATNLPARTSVRKDFTSGKSYRNMLALNQVASHLDQLSNQVDKVAGHSIPGIGNYVNAAQNSFMRNSGAPGIIDWESTADAVAHETRALFAGAGGGTLQELEGYLRTLSANNSEEQKRAAIRNISELVASRIGILQDAYSQGMGKTADPFQTAFPHAAEVLNRLSNGEKPKRAVKRTGTYGGRKVIEYTDGSVEYAN